jgi:adenosine kinase
VKIAVTGSVATDHLMTFPGKFADSIVAGSIENISLSFLVDELDVRRGGVGANITFVMGVLGLAPILIGAVGRDWDDYNSWLTRHGVDTSSVKVSKTQLTASFTVTTDKELNQIASFYPGAMQEAVNIELKPIVDRVGGADVVLIGANDPGAMARHTAECRDRGYDFAADPSQQLAFMDGNDISPLIEGAKYLFTNEYEGALIEQKSGLSTAEISAMVETRVTTLGSQGARIERRGQAPVFVDVCKPDRIADPTGVGDAFRSGYLTGMGWGLGDERAAQVGSLMATYVIETVGTQEYVFTHKSFLTRLAQNYGDSAAADVAAHLVVT